MFQKLKALFVGRGSKPPRVRDEVNALYQDRFGDIRKSEQGGLATVDFGEGDTFDYETYREVQNLGNARKIDNQFVPEAQIAHLADLLVKRLGEVRSGLCHGVRSGNEQAWFRAHLPGDPDVIGTDIAESAENFANTVQWDFHDPNPEWSGKMDFVYSNSWDHAYDFGKALASWADSLRPGGLVLLDWTESHTPGKVSVLDPFGAELSALRGIIEESGLLADIELFPGATNLSHGFTTVVARRT